VLIYYVQKICVGETLTDDLKKKILNILVTQHWRLKITAA